MNAHESPKGHEAECREIARLAGNIQEMILSQALQTMSGVWWGNLGLNWAFFEINSVSSQIRWKY